MHPRLAELVDYAEAQRAALHTAVALIPISRRETRTAPGTWTVAEILEHLHRVEHGIARLAARGVERAREAAVGPEREVESMMGSLDAFRLSDRGQRLLAPEMVMPRGEYTAERALAALAESRRALLSALEAGSGLALTEITYSHPLFGSLNLYQWVLFVGQHEARHAAQIGNLAYQFGEPTSYE